MIGWFFAFKVLSFFNNKTLVHLKGECQDNLIKQPGQTFEPLIFSNCNLLTVWYIQSHWDIFAQNRPAIFCLFKIVFGRQIQIV